MTTVTQLLERNRAMATGHQKLPFLSDYSKHGLEMPHTLVVTCADARCSPERYLGLQPTDGVVVIRNAGGQVSHEITTILTLDDLLRLDDILLVHHTDCGTLLYTDAGVKENLKKRLPAEFTAEIDAMTFGGITNLEQSVADNVTTLRASPFIRKELRDRAKGFIFNIKSGLLTEVAVK